MPETQNQETNKLLSEILKWQKLQGMNILMDLVPKLLDSDEKKIVYEMTDGKNKREDIIKETGCSAGAISSWWIDWCSKGILEKIDGGRYKKIISLAEIGIAVPKKTNKNNSQEVVINAGEEQQQNQQISS